MELQDDAARGTSWLANCSKSNLLAVCAVMAGEGALLSCDNVSKLLAPRIRKPTTARNKPI